MNGCKYNPKMTDLEFERYKSRTVLAILFIGVTVCLWGVVLLVDIVSWVSN